jgi:DNA-binding CsgD family transcriptional regulator
VVRALAELADGRAISVLQGRAVPGSAPVAYRALSEALGGAVRAGIVDPAAPALRSMSPVLSHLIPDLAADGAPTASVLGVAEGVRRFLVEAGQRTAGLLLLEDLHWADPDTLAVVEFLADNIQTEPVLCVATLRDREWSPARDLVGRLHDRRATRTVRLARLERADVDRMVASCLGAEPDDPELASLAARAEGLPFLVEELLAAAVHAGALVNDESGWTLVGSSDRVMPLTFADSVRRRLVDLGEGRSVIAAAAVLGRRFDWQLIPAIAALPEDAVTSALRAAVERQLVSVDDDGLFAFRHALTRDAVLAELLPPERASRCRAALVAVQQAHPALPGGWCEMAAGLAEQAGDRVRASELLRLVGGRAFDAGALGSARVAFERARTLASGEDVVDIEEQLADVLAHAGRPDEATAVGESLLERLGEDPANARRRAEVLLGIARAAVAAGELDRAADRVARAAGVASSLADPALQARIDVVAAQVAVLREPREAMARAERALGGAERAGLVDVACEALEIIGRLHRGTDLFAAEAVFERARALAAREGREVWRMRALHELGTIDLLRSGDVSRLHDARELAQQLGAVSAAAVVDVQIGAMLTCADDPEPGLVPCRRAERVARRHRLQQTLAASLAFQAVAHARAGRQSDLDRCVVEALELGSGMPEVRYNIAWARAHAALVRDDRAAASAALVEATAAGGVAVGVETSGPIAGVAALFVALADDATAAGRLTSPAPVHFIGAAYASYARAVRSGRTGDAESSRRDVAAGDAFLGGFAWYRHLGHRYLAEAAIADGWGDPSQWLLEALAFFDAPADQRIASACRSLLRKAGVPVPRRRSAPSDLPELRELGITAREAEVLELLGRGLTNLEIGDQLYLSPRTVERHVANLTDKVGVTRRAELVAFAARRSSRTPTV